jgi:hypothetical protein
VSSAVSVSSVFPFKSSRTSSLVNIFIDCQLSLEAGTKVSRPDIGTPSSFARDGATVITLPHPCGPLQNDVANNALRYYYVTIDSTQ